VPVLVHRLSGPTTPNWQRHQALPPAGFGLFPFRSPLLRESQLLSLPRGTQMFQFPRFPPLVLFYSDQGHAPLRARGFPIRTSTDRSLIGSSPWLIAAIHVLHRHQAPRHPPLALHSLEITSKRCSCLLSNSQGAASASRRFGEGRAKAPLENGTEETGQPRAHIERRANLRRDGLRPMVTS
jgi:hypothetical protein